MFSDALVSEYHPTRNARSLHEFKPMSNKKVWWKCSKNSEHEWEANLSNRTKGTGCPMCSGRVTDRTNNLFIKYPDIAAEWHPTKNTTLPQNTAPGSNKSVWWKCSKNPEHEWETAPNSRVKGHGCPHCTGRTTFGGNTVADKFPQLLKEWDYEKNKNTDPKNICPGSDTKVWWLCLKENHSFETKISNRTLGETGCPICKNKKVIYENSLVGLFPDIAIEWHPTKNGELKPVEIIPNNSKQIWWKCSKSHEWQATPNNRTRFSNKCPACSGRVASSENNLLLKYPVVAKEWHPTKNGDLKPENFTPASHSKVWWLCPKNHSYFAKIQNRTTGSKSGCPMCNQSKMEKSTFETLTYYDTVFEPQKKFHGLKYKGYSLSYDFYLPTFNAIIECDGRQHFEEATDYFHHEKSFQHQRLRDVVKNAYAAREGIALLRIAYTEIDYIPLLVQTFLNRLRHGERPYNFVGGVYKSSGLNYQSDKESESETV